MKLRVWSSPSEDFEHQTPNFLHSYEFLCTNLWLKCLQFCQNESPLLLLCVFGEIFRGSCPLCPPEIFTYACIVQSLKMQHNFRTVKFSLVELSTSVFLQVTPHLVSKHQKKKTPLSSQYFMDSIIQNNVMLYFDTFIVSMFL